MPFSETTSNATISVGSSYDTSRFTLGNTLPGNLIELIPLVTETDLRALEQSTLPTFFKVYNSTKKLMYSWYGTGWSIIHNEVASSLTSNLTTTQKIISISGNSPVTGQALVAISDTEAQWQTVSGGGSGGHLFAGTIQKPTITDNLNGTVTLGSGQYQLFTNADGVGFTELVTLSGGTFGLSDFVNNYIVANYNGGSPELQVITDVSLINETTIIPVYTVYRQGTSVHMVNWDTLGSALANKIHQSIVKTSRFRRESGFALTEAATRRVLVSSGIVWMGAVKHALDDFDSLTHSMVYCYHSSGVWQYSNVSQYNNTHYDNGTNIVATSNNKYVVNFIYRGIEDDPEVYLILGSRDYTLAEAQAAQPPSIHQLPPAIASHGMLVGRIIIVKDASSAAEISSAFAVNFTQSALTTTSNVNSVQWELNPTVTPTTGLTYWDAAHGTLNTILDSGAGVSLQHGQEVHVRVVNRTGATIVDGSAVYINGAHGNRPTIALADADALSTSPVLGVATQNILDGAEGFVTILGVINGFNTSGFVEGGQLYLSGTPGQLTQTIPADPQYAVCIGTALNSTINGSILVRPTNPRGTGNPYISPSDLLAPTQKAISMYTAAISGANFTGDISAPNMSTNTLVLPEGSIHTATITTSTTAANQVLDTCPANSSRALKYLVAVTSGSNYHMTEISLLHDGTNVILTEYGTLLTGPTLAVFDADILSGSVRLLVTPTNAVTTIKLVRTLVK